MLKEREKKKKRKKKKEMERWYQNPQTSLVGVQVPTKVLHSQALYFELHITKTANKN